MTQLEDLKYGRAKRTPPADGAVRAMAVGKRRRRTRYAVAATVAILVAGFVPLESILLSNSASPPARPVPPPTQATQTPPRYSAVGEIESYPNTNPRYCLTGDFGSDFDGASVTRDPCLNEPILRNVDARRLSMQAGSGGGIRTTGTVRVTGTYANGFLTLTQPPVTAKPEEPSLNFPIPCRAPAGGWKGPTADVNVSQPDEATMNTFTITHAASFGGWWLARAPAGVIVVGVTSDVAGAQRELDSKLQGNVCVTKVAHTDRYLTSVADEVTRLDMVDKQLYLSGWGPSAVTSTVDVRLRIADPATRRFFAAHFPPGVIRLQPFLVQVH